MRTWRCALVPVFVPHAPVRRASRPGPALPRHPCRTRLQVLVVALMVVVLVVLVLVLALLVVLVVLVVLVLALALVLVVLLVLVPVLVLVLLMLASRLMATIMMRQPRCRFAPSRTPPVVQGQPW